MVSKTLMAASTRPIILAILSRGEDYGYSIIQRVKDISGGILEWTDGMLYPVLQRMEMDGLIASKWKLSGENPSPPVLHDHREGPEGTCIRAGQLAKCLAGTEPAGGTHSGRGSDRTGGIMFDLENAIRNWKKDLIKHEVFEDADCC